LNIIDSAVWDTWLGVPPQTPIEDEDMKALLYTVTAADGQYSWFLHENHKVRQIRNGHEYQDLITAGGIPLNFIEGPAKYAEVLSTLQPVGALGTTGKAVLGDAATADWERRANTEVTVTIPDVNVEIPTGTIQGSITF